MELHAPQIIALSLMLLGLGVSLALHGKPKEGNVSFWIHLTSATIWSGLLYWGGFFG